MSAPGNRVRCRRGVAAAAALAALAGAGHAQVTLQNIVVPATAPLGNGNAAMALPGFPSPLHVQIVIDAVHLQPLIGQTIHGLVFRRQQHPRPFAGGAALWTVQIAQAATTAALVAPVFAQNFATPTAVRPTQFVVAPPSPGGGGPWDAADTVQVPVAPFAYGGGPLLLDLAGRPDLTQPAAEWPVDAVQWPRVGAAATTVGGGCGAYGGGNWSFVEPSTLLVGQTTAFSAIGAPGGFGMLLLNDAAAPFVFDLAPLGAAAGCHLHVAASVLTLLAPFSPPMFPGDPAAGGLAVVAVEIPRDPAFLSAMFTDQWLDFGQVPFAASPAHTFTIAAVPPGAGISTVVADLVADPQATRGEVRPDFAPVLRLLY